RRRRNRQSPLYGGRLNLSHFARKITPCWRLSTSGAPLCRGFLRRRAPVVDGLDIEAPVAADPKGWQFARLQEAIDGGWMDVEVAGHFFDGQHRRLDFGMFGSHGFTWPRSVVTGGPQCVEY